MITRLNEILKNCIARCTYSISIIFHHSLLMNSYDFLSANNRPNRWTDSMHEVAPPTSTPPLPPHPTSPPYPPPYPPPPPYLPPLPSTRFARQTARFALRGGQPPHPP